MSEELTTHEVAELVQRVRDASLAAGLTERQSNDVGIDARRAGAERLAEGRR
jgi:hypothetical protein